MNGCRNIVPVVAASGHADVGYLTRISPTTEMCVFYIVSEGSEVLKRYLFR